MGLLEKEIHVVVNPVGASGAARKAWLAAEKEFVASGRRFSVHYSAKGRGIKEICRELTADDTEKIITIVGGDGTLDHAINGIRDLSKVVVGFIPAGSANDLAKDLGMDYKMVAQNARRILQADSFTELDLGEVLIKEPCLVTDSTHRIVEKYAGPSVRRLFHDGCGFGFDAEICQMVESSSLKKPLNTLKLGKLIYIIIAIRMILGFKKPDFTVTAGEESFEMKHALFAVGMQHRYEGGGFMFCPKADATDGLTDFCAANPRTNLAFFRIFPTAYKGNHVKFGCVRSGLYDHFTIRSTTPQWIHTDGETEFTASEVTIGTAKEKLRMIL